jgi:pyruvate/2-oxoglutarate dehydrogenase complex dihydrolipoamide dehydrogenase (E3) component
MARIVVQNALFLGRARTSQLVIPWCTYTDPELAHIGLTERQATEQGIRVDRIDLPLSDVHRALLDDQAVGQASVLVRAGTDQIAGATIVAAHAGDMEAPLSLAMTAGLGLKSVARTILPYPTQAEAVRKLAEAYNRTRLTPRVAGLLRTWLRWRWW